MSAPSSIRHPSPGDLALIALGAEAPTPADQHVPECETCLSTLNSFLRVLAAGREGPVAAARPPDTVWEAIRREL
ncbi:hypothetical protein [Streptomyces sp. cg35]|uniref:hypothetical protein n=1 Tax=Streptomyces sp. cg35 TaxID=3421650 RepID=UPI003D17BCEC